VITDRLPTGPGGVLRFEGATQVLGANVTAEIPNPVPTLTDTDGDGIADSIRFDFGRVTVLGDNLIDARDTIRIELTASVPDDPRNLNGARLEAPVLLDFGTGTDSATVDVEIVEPKLLIDKTALTPQRFIGQVASYEIRVFHAADSAVAADVTVIDTLAPGLTLVPGSLVILSAPPGASVNGTSVSVPLLPLGSEIVFRFEAVIGLDIDPTKPFVNTASVDWDSNPGPGGRPGTAEDTALVTLLGADVRRRDEALGWLDETRYVETLPQIDPIYSGTAQPGSRISLSLADALGGVAGTAHVMADAGGNWLALMPSVLASSEGWNRPDPLAGSRLFEPMHGLPPVLSDGIGERRFEVRVGAFVPDQPYALHVAQTASAPLMQDEAAPNLRAFFAPAWRDQLFIDQPLSVETVFRDLAGTAIARDFAAARTPLGFGANAFNSEFLASGAAGGAL
jgi:uncharacterized repeat protein (TIGR01451 family)